MPFASETGGKVTKAGKDQGWLASALGKAVDVGTDISPIGLLAKAAGKDLLDENTAAANVRGATDFLNPSNLATAATGMAVQQARALPTALATAHLAATGQLNDQGIKSVEQSPLSFGFDTANLRKQQELFNRNEGATGIADKINAGMGLVAPALPNITESFAQTGLRGGAAVGAGITQTGLAGPRLTPNQAAELIGVPSYGQAAEQGQAGAMALGDILNIAPALKGASFAGAANPIPEAAGAKIAQAGAALERAPLAPYSVPAKATYEALQRGMFGADVAPSLARMAEKEIPVVSNLAGRGEQVLKDVSGRWANAYQRAEGLRQQGITNREARPLIDTLQGKINDLEAAQGAASPQLEASVAADNAAKFKAAELDSMPENDPGRAAAQTELDQLQARADELRAQVPDSAELQDAYAAREDLHSELKADALRETKYQLARKADAMAKKLNIPADRLVPTNAFGKIFEEVNNELATNAVERAPVGADFKARPIMAPATAPTPKTLPEGPFAEDLLAQRERRFAEPTPVLGQPGLFDQGISPKTIAKGREFAATQGKPVQLGLGESATPKGISQEAIQAAKNVEPASVSQLGLPGIEPASAGSVESLYRGEAGKAIRSELKANEKLSPGAVREIPENFSDKYIEASLKGLATPTLPEGFAGKGLKYYDNMITAWKTGVLPLRPAWHTSNIVGNAMGAMLMGEVSPIWFAQNIKRIMGEVDALQKGGKSELVGASTGRGLGVEIASDLQNVGDKGLLGKMKRGAQKSYEFNEKVDDFSHVAVALHELDRQLAAGVPVAQAVDAAEAFSLKTMGDFGNMGAGERTFIRRALPFYPWYKHIAKATLRFPMENPARFLQSQAWANRVTGGPQAQPAGAEYLGGMVPMGGGRFLSVGGADLGMNVENNPLLNPTNTFTGVAPPLQWLAAANGLNLARGRELQTAPGQNRASAMAGYAINQLPILKMPADVLDTIRGEGGIVRGDTRAPIVSGGHPILQSAQGIGPLPASAISYLTGATYQEPNLPAAAARAKKAEKTAATQEKAYQKAVKKKPKK